MKTRNVATFAGIQIFRPLQFACVGALAMMASACVSTETVEVDQRARAATAIASSGQPSEQAQSAVTQLPDAPDRDEILAAVDTFFVALAGKDADTLDDLISANALSVTTYPEVEGQPVRYGRTSNLVQAIRAGTLPKIEEPYWDPIVLQRKTMAVVWAPYEVWVDETLNHCGIDVFNLTRQSGKWKIDAVHWTDEPSACEELWPDGRSQLRPNMFSKGM